MNPADDGATETSVGPPGWKPGATVSAAAPALAIGPPARDDRPMPADAAVRWRLGAARIDNVIVYGAYLLLCAVAHWRVSAPDHLIVLGLGSVAYHFLLESRGGQTIGKQRYGIRVVDVGGGPASQKAILVRSVLRILDQLPVWYASGLVSMIKTGPARRQRIGDVAAQTVVVAVGGRAARQGTPGWYLPAATLAAVALSAVLAISALNARSAPLNAAKRAEFVTNCAQNATVAQCQCLLTQLQAAGYESADDFKALADRERAAIAAGRPGDAPPALVRAVQGCRNTVNN